MLLLPSPLPVDSSVSTSQVGRWRLSQHLAGNNSTTAAAIRIWVPFRERNFKAADLAGGGRLERTCAEADESDLDELRELKCTSIGGEAHAVHLIAEAAALFGAARGKVEVKAETGPFCVEVQAQVFDCELRRARTTVRGNDVPSCSTSAEVFGIRTWRRIAEAVLVAAAANLAAVRECGLNVEFDELGQRLRGNLMQRCQCLLNEITENGGTLHLHR